MNLSLTEVLTAALVLGGLGAAFAALLSVCHRFLAVKGDPKLEMFLSILPGSNCGACGHAGCMGFAESLLKDGAEPTGCLAGGAAVAGKLAKAMGISLEPQTELVAFVACQAGRKTARMKYQYVGVQDCRAANLLYGGDKLCAQGCLGLGSCARACPFDAIAINPDGLALVDREKCRSCQKCVAACPRRLIRMVPKHQTVLVACRSLERGKHAKETCPLACIACRICEKTCPVKAIAVTHNLAVIDDATCTRCGLCVTKCPQKSIIRLGAETPAATETGEPGQPPPQPPG